MTIDEQNTTPSATPDTSDASGAPATDSTSVSANADTPSAGAAPSGTNASSPLGRAAKVDGVPFRATNTIPPQPQAAGSGGFAGPPPGTPPYQGTPPYPGMVWGYPYVATVEARKSWRKRHPILFWLGMIILVLITINIVAVHIKGPSGGPKVAVVDIWGIILDSEDVVTWIEDIRKDNSVKSVVIRVNSPGGAVSPSQEIYHAVKRLAAKKPVVVSMGARAASGGYYVSLGANEIFANPSTLTASIGVKMQVPNMQGLMQTIGISEKTLTTGALKDAGNVSREMSAPEQAYFQELLTDMFDEFVTTVMRERDLTREEVMAVADGRAMTGRQALKAGLIDRIGDYHDAMISAMALGGFTPEKIPEIVVGPVEEKTLLQQAIGTIMDIHIQQQNAVQPVFMY